jgi:hypothetical protein
MHASGEVTKTTRSENVNCCSYQGFLHRSAHITVSPAPMGGGGTQAWSKGMEEWSPAQRRELAVTQSGKDALQTHTH